MHVDNAGVLTARGLRKYCLWGRDRPACCDVRERLLNGSTNVCQHWQQLFRTGLLLQLMPSPFPSLSHGERLRWIGAGYGGGMHTLQSNEGGAVFAPDM